MRGPFVSGSGVEECRNVTTCHVGLGSRLGGQMKQAACAVRETWHGMRECGNGANVAFACCSTDGSVICYRHGDLLIVIVHRMDGRSPSRLPPSCEIVRASR